MILQQLLQYLDSTVPVQIPKLVERLFEEEVTEIKDGIVEIMGIAREAGSRTKMAVRAKVPNVDPVGACVGVNGARVKAIVNELGNEQIDIIEWDENPAQLIVNALSPAKVVSATESSQRTKAAGKRTDCGNESGNSTGK